jgi:hypothetical protein
MREPVEQFKLIDSPDSTQSPDGDRLRAFAALPTGPVQKTGNAMNLIARNKSIMSMIQSPFLSTSLAAAACVFCVHLASAADNPPLPSGPQTDGPFRKVILDSDQQLNGKWADTLKDPMELAVASDGRVFYAQRDGTIKMWRPETKTTVVIAKIPVFAGL